MKPAGPLRVGLTGNIASGKSAVAEVWRRLGAAVISADELARRAVEPGTPALESIAREFGARALDADGRLDRDYVRDVVFRVPAARRRLESIIHPEVARLRRIEEDAARRDGARIIVNEIPLLFERGMEREFDAVVLVDSPEETRVRRLVHVRGLDEAEARRMVAAQMPASRKRAAADLVIENDGTIGDLERRAEAAWRELERRAAARSG